MLKHIKHESFHFHQKKQWQMNFKYILKLNKIAA